VRGSWITDIRHFLNEDGTIPKLLPPAARLADYFGSIIDAVTSQINNNIPAISTGIRCRRRPGRKRCTGEIIASLDWQNALHIKWYCPVCGDNGIISGWQETIWDRR
jgi:hypothetical protein